MNTDIIQVVQLPVIEQRLQNMKEAVLRRANELDALVCTEETVKEVKKARAEFRKELSELEASKSAVLEQVMAPVEQFKAVYRDCISGPYTDADRRCKDKIDAVESEIKRRCEDELREYFAECCAVNHVEWLEYERYAPKISITEAKQKTHGRQKSRIKVYVEQAASDVSAISKMPLSDEIMVEYRERLDMAKAVNTVMYRHKQMEAVRVVQEANAEVERRMQESVERVEAVAPPEPVLTVAFKATGTKSQLIKLREYMKQEGIKHE